MGVDPRFCTEHAHGQLFFGHFQRKQGHGILGFDGRIASDIQGKGGLSHTGAGRQDDQVRRLKSRCQIVEIGKAGRHAGDQGAVALAFFELVDILFNEGADRVKRFAGLVLGNFEYGLFGKIKKFIHIAAVLEASLDNLVGFGNQAADAGLVMDDFGIMDRIDRHGGGVDQLGKEGRPPDVLQGAFLLQDIGQGDEIHRLAAGKEIRDRFEDPLVRGAVEILGRKDLQDIQQR